MMDLELLKERFGHSIPSKKADNREKIHEKLAARFGHLGSTGDIKSIKNQHLEDLEKRDGIIENLQAQSYELAEEVKVLKKEKSALLNDLNKSRWMEKKINSMSKKVYEDKLREMSYVDSTKLIPLLTSVARKKQGNTKLNWKQWLKIPENMYLTQINQSIAEKVFRDTNRLIDEYIYYLNKRKGRGTDTATENYVLTFSGNTGDASESYVATDFNPDTYNLNLGFTVSYWVRPDEVGNTMFALGRKHSNNERFTFGINRKRQGYFAVGSNKLANAWVNMDTPVEESLLVQDGEYWNLKSDGTWYHFAITYDDRTDTSSGADRKVYVNGVLRHTGTINWSSTGGSTGGIYFGARNLTDDYDNGWACGLDEVAIYDTAKDAHWVSEVYKGETDFDHTDASNLVGYWKFDEGKGSTIKDYSGNGNHGTFGAISGDTTAHPIWSKR